MPHHVRYSNAKEFPATSNKEKKTIESNGKRAVHAVGSLTLWTRTRTSTTKESSFDCTAWAQWVLCLQILFFSCYAHLLIFHPMPESLLVQAIFALSVRCSRERCSYMDRMMYECIWALCSMLCTLARVSACQEIAVLTSHSLYWICVYVLNCSFSLCVFLLTPKSKSI